MKFDMKKAIDLAKEGMTKEELMQYFGINEKEYYSCLKSFPKKDRETLRGLFMILHLLFLIILILKIWME